MGDKLDLFSGILTDQAGFDLAMSTWLYKKTREIVRRLDVYRGEVAMLHPPFAATSAAAIKRRSEPLPSDVEDIQYTAEDDRILGEWVRNALSQNWHGIGTCKMAPRHDRGVVDHNLDVYGIRTSKLSI
jgi:choline dehydrogenase-like flavoprotein